MKIQLAYVVAALTILVACGHGGSAGEAPKGWRAVPGSSAVWTSGSAAQEQEYRYARAPYRGGLQDLASAVTIEVLLHHPGAKLRSSSPFAPCPGQAGVARFSLPGGRELDEGFAVFGGDSVRTTYVRPAGTPPDPNVSRAMQNALCVRPA